jgi:hypothetical protein
VFERWRLVEFAWREGEWSLRDGVVGNNENAGLWLTLGCGEVARRTFSCFALASSSCSFVTLLARTLGY